MAEVTPQEAARISSHMNAEHPDSLIHYLEFLGDVPPSLATQSPRITSFSTSTGMKIEYGPQALRKEYVVKFNPPMYAGQARSRLVELHNLCREGLGLSEITINSFPPTVLLSIPFLLLLLLQLAFLLSPPTFLVSHMPWPARHASALLSRLGVRTTVSHVANAIKVGLEGPLVVIHLVEVVWVLRPLMYRYNMTSTLARTLWTLATIPGGVSIWSQLKRQGGEQEFALKQKAAQGKAH